MSQGAANRESATPFKPGYYISDYTPKLAEAGPGPFFGRWWTFTPTVSGTITLTSERTTPGGVGGPDTVLELWQGEDLVDSDDNSLGGGLSKLTASVTAGVQYDVQVGTADASGESVEFYVLTAELPGDEPDSTLVWAVDVSFADNLELSQVYSATTRGPYTVFMVQLNTATLSGAYVVMKYLGNGDVTFGPLYRPEESIGFGATFVYDDVFVDQIGSTGALGGYRIDPTTLQITRVGSNPPTPLGFQGNWRRAQLVNEDDHSVYVYSDIDTSDGKSYAFKCTVGSSGSVSGWTLVWTDDEGFWSFADNVLRFSTTEFVDAADYMPVDPFAPAVFHNVVVNNITGSGAPSVGSTGLSADSEFWQSLNYAPHTSQPGSGKRNLFVQGSATQMVAEIQLGGTHLNIVNTMPKVSDGWSISAGEFTNSDDSTISVPVLHRGQLAEPYAREYLYDPWGIGERYPLVLAADRSLTATTPHGVLSDGGFFVVHQGGGWPATNPMIRLWYRPTPTETTVFGIPPLRQVQRGDGLGFSSAPRAIQNNSVQGSLRNFGFV